MTRLHLIFTSEAVIEHMLLCWASLHDLMPKGSLESQNILSWKGPTGISESNSCRGKPPKSRHVSGRIIQILPELWQNWCWNHFLMDTLQREKAPQQLKSAVLNTSVKIIPIWETLPLLDLGLEITQTRVGTCSLYKTFLSAT